MQKNYCLKKNFLTLITTLELFNNTNLKQYLTHSKI